MVVSVKNIRNLFETKHASLITHDEYSLPKHKATKWALLRGPYYRDQGFRGSLLIDLTKMIGWAQNQSSNTWTNQSAQQKASEYLPIWLSNIDLEIDAITLLDKDQHKLFQYNYIDFVKNEWHQMYCPDCNKLTKTIDMKTFNNRNLEKNISWSTEWHCESGHFLYNGNESIRIF